MSAIFTEKDIKNVIAGATILGGGGGGSMQGGLDLLNKYKETHPGKEVSLTILEPKEIGDADYTAITAGMGSPVALKDVDFTPYAVNSFEALVDMAAKMQPSKTLKNACAVEMGGFNTFVPMLISLLKGIPFIDADGAGRAVPALDTLLLHVNGCNTSPLAMADAKNNRLTIELADPMDAHEAEVIGRNICVAFDMISGLSGWMLTKSEIMDNIANNTVSYARFIGECLAKYDGKGNVYDYLRSNKLECKGVCSGKITKVETKTAGGFDYGVVYVDADDGAKIRVLFQNENLVIYRGEEVVMTCPDIITFYSKESGIPLTNADVKEGMYVDIGLFEVDKRWWNTGEKNVNDIWKLYFKNVEYTGDIVRYK